MLAYMRLVLERNEVMNLTSITDEDEFVRRHLIDSVAALGLPELTSAQRVVDVGSGAGFPGVPLAIACPDKEFLLIDSLGKRVDFVSGACASLGIDNVNVLHSRAESAAAGGRRESFDLAVCRAVGSLSVLCEYCLPLVREGGAVYAYKSDSQEEEPGESAHALTTLGASPDVEVVPAGSGRSGHIIMVVKKVSATPGAYPRRPGAATKRPL
jgi:16S rRNA (guanine527-N7)-methyltransferase